MNVLISTNMYRADEVKRVLPYLEKYEGKLGVEIFPMFHKAGYDELLRECLGELRKVPVSFHGPYYRAEYSERPGTPAYRMTLALTYKTLSFAHHLGSRYFVFHHNNRSFEPQEKAAMVQASCANYRGLEKICREYSIPLVVENAGVKANRNMLFDEREFIDLCRSEGYRVLLDIGHAHANGWDLTAVMEALRGQIVSYHLHNNDGLHDAHQRIHCGTLDFDRFLADCRMLTPQADLVLEYGADVADDEAGITADLEQLLR